MNRTLFRSRLFLAVATLVALAVAAPAPAQSTGMVKGKVVDAQNNPVEGAKITIDFGGGVNRKHETKTNKKGEYLQIGLAPGPYKVTAEKEKLGAQTFDATVKLGGTAEVNFRLAPGTAGPSKEDVAKAGALKKAFDEGVTLSRAGSWDEAIAKFTEAAAVAPCPDCYYNIGFAQTSKKNYPEAEAAYKKAIELKADYADAYNGLATVYNAMRKFDEASAASAKAVELSGGAAGAPGAAAGAGGGNADAMYNQGVILWNAGKIPDAKTKFEEAVKINPGHAEAHYQLGLALLNEGKMAEALAHFEENVKLAPEGPHAAQAKQMITMLKK
jgi:tetratricopeptide (TPR) repeat protein